MCARQDNRPDCGLTEIVERLEALIGQEHVAEEYVRFRIDLLKAQWAAREALLQAGPPAPVAGERHSDDNGRQPTLPYPILAAGDIPLDRDLLQSLLTACCQAVSKLERESRDADRLAAAARQEPALLEDLARQAAFAPDHENLESLGRRLDVAPDALVFLGRALAAPFVSASARQAGTLAEPAAAQASGSCFVCGSPAAIAKLRQDDGKRILCCSLCGQSWEFPRLACPCCDSRDRETLGTLRLTKEDRCWIETCEKCHGYVKTVDERKLPAGTAIIPLVEETATLHLDLLAEKEGYLRRLPYTAVG